MYPYITWWASKIYMTGVGLIIAFIVFLVVGRYLTRKTYQNFWKFFYRLPFLIISMYVLGALTTSILERGSLLSGIGWFFSTLSPYGYKFHFAGVVVGAFISIGIFLKKIVRIENRKNRADILFFAFSLCIVPLGIFLMLGDNFIGFSTDSIIGIKTLHFESQLNKFDAVYPIGLFLSIWSLLTALFILILKQIKKKTGYGMLGFAILLFVINIILMFQQCPRYGVISIGSVMIDIKQYVSFLAIMYCLYINHIRRENELEHITSPTLDQPGMPITKLLE